MELSSRGSLRRIPIRVTTQIPLYLSSRKEFSVASQPNASKGPGSTGKPSDSGSNFSKVVIGSVAIGAAGLTAYQTGHLDKLLTKESQSDLESTIPAVNKEPQELPKVGQDSGDREHAVKQIAVPNFQEPNITSLNVERPEKNIEIHSSSSKTEGENDFQVNHISKTKPQEDIVVQGNDVASSPQSRLNSDNGDKESNISSTALSENLVVKRQEETPTTAQAEAVESTPIFSQAAGGSTEHEIKSEPPRHLNTRDMVEDSVSNDINEPGSLLDEYHLQEKAEDSAAASSFERKGLVETVKDSNDVYIDKDGKLVLDFLQAIHTAEKRQAELDAQIFAEEKRIMKEKYEKELKDARARELMYAEREAILDKELNKEKIKAAAALKSLQGKLEEKLRMEIEQKEAEAELELKKIQELARAELAAKIASEKASQIEKMAEANLNINALCLAFFARSEEARQSHSVHKLAMGALALEDALSKGLPIQKEINALHTHLEGIDKDSLLDLVLSSLPEETLKYGTANVLQLNQKFDALKGTLRHFSLIPPGGGGLLAHSLAYVASFLKVREAGQSGNGIESLINRVESFLAEGKLLEAANTLEDGLKGSLAAEVVADWVRQARNRAITEQALTLLQSYATSLSLT